MIYSLNPPGNVLWEKIQRLRRFLNSFRNLDKSIRVAMQFLYTSSFLLIFRFSCFIHEITGNDILSKHSDSKRQLFKNIRGMISPALSYNFVKEIEAWLPKVFCVRSSRDFPSIFSNRIKNSMQIRARVGGAANNRRYRSTSPSLYFSIVFFIGPRKLCQESKIEKSVNIFDVFDIPLKATVYVP